jgi:Tol biopolymer transport system component
MRTIAVAMTAAAALTLSAVESPHMLTVVQQDSQRSPFDAPSVAVSADGRFVAFVSYARLAPADTNGVSDIYVLDRASGQTTLESLASDGSASAADSDHPAISGDGTLLVYETCGEVRLRDRREDNTRVIGAGRDPTISRDGRIVAFASTAADLVSNPNANGQIEDIYLYEVATGQVRRIGVTSSGVPPFSGARVTPSVSADGRYIAFGSLTSLPSTAHAPRPLSQVYVRDNQLNTTTRVSEGWKPAISADGRYVAFVSGATNLVAGDRNRSPDVFLADLKAGSIELVSRSARGGSANGTSIAPALSADARFVAFQSDASDLVCARRCTAADDDINLLWDVFVLDRRDHSMTRLSADAKGGWMEASVGPALDSAGDVIAFSSRHPIDAADVKNDFDLFIVQR